MTSLSVARVIESALVGLITGLVTSYLVGRSLYKKTLLDPVNRNLKRCCPYRRNNVREGDGLEETAWAFKIDSELLRSAGFGGCAAAVQAIADEMQELPSLPTNAAPAETAARDKLKETWQTRVSSLYSAMGSKKTVSGYRRLGIVLSIGWLLLFPAIYFLCLVNLTPIAEVMDWLYTWVYPDDRHGVLTVNWLALISVSILPVMLPWLFLFIIPAAIRWIKDGFAQQRR